MAICDKCGEDVPRSILRYMGGGSNFCRFCYAGRGGRAKAPVKIVKVEKKQEETKIIKRPPKVKKIVVAKPKKAKKKKA